MTTERKKGDVSDYVLIDTRSKSCSSCSQFFVFLFTSPSRPAGGVFRLQLLLPVQLRGVRLRLLRVPLQRGRVAGGRPTPSATRPIRPVSVRRRDQQPVSVLPVGSPAADCWFCRPISTISALKCVVLQRQGTNKQLFFSHLTLSVLFVTNLKNIWNI